MDENDFSKFGQSICDTVTDAVNSAMESMDFFRIKRENFIDSRSYHAGDDRSILPEKNGQGKIKKGNVYEKTDKEKARA